MRLVGEKFRATFPQMMPDDESINLVGMQEAWCSQSGYRC
jgi:hypothetical protein